MDLEHLYLELENLFMDLENLFMDLDNLDMDVENLYMDVENPLYGVYLVGGFAPRTPLWRLRRASCWCEGVLNTGGARPAPAKCAYPPARPAKCAFPSLLVVLFCFVLFGCST